MEPKTLRVGILVAGFIAIAIAASWRLAGKGYVRHSVAFWLAWFAPGLGHVMIGRWRKALFFLGAVAALYVSGLWLSGWRTVSFEDNPFYYVGQFGCGLTTLLGSLLGNPKSYPREDLPLSWYDPGLLYVCVAGLLNIVIMANVLGEMQAIADAEAKEKSAEGKPA